MKKVKEKFACGISVEGEKISNLLYAEDIVLLTEQVEGIEKLLIIMDKILKEDFGLNIK